MVISGGGVYTEKEEETLWGAGNGIYFDLDSDYTSIYIYKFLPAAHLK